ETEQFFDDIATLETAARFPFLDAFRSSPVTEPVHYSWFEKRFTEVFPRPRRGDRDFVLRAWLWGLAAPGFSCAKQAREVLLAAYRQCREQPHFQRQIRNALRRAGQLELPDREAYLKSYEDAYGKMPELWGTALLEEAEYALSDDPRRAGELFARAERIIAEYFPD